MHQDDYDPLITPRFFGCLILYLFSFIYFFCLLPMTALTAIPAIVWLLISAIFFAGGEYFSKLWGMSPSLAMTAAVVGTYSLSTIVWLPALLHRNELAIMGTLWLLLATLATVSIGIVVFHEHINAFQGTGIALAAIALVLMNIPN